MTEPTPARDPLLTGLQSEGTRLMGLRALAALSFLVTGAPPGRASLSQPSTVMGSWLPLIGASVTGLAMGGLAVGSMELPEMRALGGVLAAAGGAATVTTVLAACSVERLVPPPHRPRVLAGQPHPLLSPEPPRGLTPYGTDLWVAHEAPGGEGGAGGARMTVLRLPEGLMVVCPVAANPDLLEEVRSLGPVRWVVVPNPLRAGSVRGWVAAFPEALCVAGPGFAERHPDLPPARTLHGVRPELPWPADAVDAVVVEGHPVLKEIALFHAASGTLIVSDLVAAVGYAPETPRRERLRLELQGMKERPGPPLSYKLTVTEPATVRAAIDRLLAWPFHRVLASRGRPIEVEASTVIRDAFAFVR